MWQRIFTELAGDSDFEEVFIDSTVIRAHQHAAGARKEEGAPAIGRSRGGLTTKIHALVESLGNLARWRLTPGQAADVCEAEALLAGIPAQAVAADKAYDPDALIDTITASGAQAVIPPRANRNEPRSFDRHIYKGRNLVELLLSHQTLSSDRNPLRETRQTLRGLHRHHRRIDLARLMSTLPRA